MTRNFLLTIFFSLFVLAVQANTSRALVIGIDLYKPPGDSVRTTTRSLWRNLSGCVNDAEAMRTLLLARYGFTPQNITKLYNQEASRQQILASVSGLLQQSKKGDVVFIFYAGHGSQVTNSLSVEKDQRDESIVPADAYKGAADIRDKELAALFNQFLDKGVLLTVIFDSCHSGSAGRGLLHDVASRFLDENPLDAKDPSDPPKPEERGALILSAAQDFEFAKEVKDENNVTHGAFSLALLKALQQNPVDATVEDIFSSVKAIMKFYGKTQEPVLAGIEARRKGTLFGLAKGTLKNQVGIAVTKAEGNTAELMGGFALGLSVGIKLKSLAGKDTLVVTQMLGANRSLAKTTSGRKLNVAPGSLFQVVSWTSSSGPALRVYVPASGLSEKELASAVGAYQQLRSAKKWEWTDDLTKAPAQHLFQFSGVQGWQSRMAAENQANHAVQTASTKSRTAIAFANFPPAATFVASLKEQFSTYNNIELVSDPADALYSLVGRLNEKNELGFAFVKTGFALQDSTESLPVRTDFEPIDLAGAKSSVVSEKLAESLFRIARLKDWLSLQSPSGANRFPFRLQIQPFRSDVAPVSGQVRLGDTLSFYLQRSSDETWNRKKRYVYIFSIDAKGAMSLLYPSPAKGNVENRLPVTGAYNKPQDKTHLLDIRVAPPTGYDTYFMLSTEEAISNLSAFQQPGVVSRGPSATSVKNPMERLLFTGTKSRSNITTPLTWTLEKIVLKSTERTHE